MTRIHEHPHPVASKYYIAVPLATYPERGYFNIDPEAHTLHPPQPAHITLSPWFKHLDGTTTSTVVSRLGELCTTIEPFHVTFGSPDSSNIPGAQSVEQGREALVALHLGIMAILEKTHRFTNEEVQYFAERYNPHSTIQTVPQPEGTFVPVYSVLVIGHYTKGGHVLKGKEKGFRLGASAT